MRNPRCEFRSAGFGYLFKNKELIWLTINGMTIKNSINFNMEIELRYIGLDFGELPNENCTRG